MHAKTDSEVTSLTLSSPPRSPRRPVYYVQSPSRDSHDGEKTATSFHSTPALSPTASPPRHSHSSVGPHSRDSSSSRFSGSIKPGRGRKIAATGAVVADEKGAARGRIKLKQCATIEEEGLLEEEDEQRGLPRRCYYLAFVLGFAVLFSFFALILWGASRSQKPRVTMKSITFENFIIQAGTDASLVPTDMSTLNSTVSFVFLVRILCATKASAPLRHSETTNSCTLIARESSPKTFGAKNRASSASLRHRKSSQRRFFLQTLTPRRAGPYSGAGPHHPVPAPGHPPPRSRLPRHLRPHRVQRQPAGPIPGPRLGCRRRSILPR